MHARRRTCFPPVAPRRRRAAWLLGAVLLAGGTVGGVVSDVVAQPAPTRVGYVDMKRLLDNSPQVLAANARLKQEFDARDAELKRDEARLAELDGRIASGGANAPDALQRQADALRRSVERTRQRLRDDLRTRSQEEVDRAWPLINDAIAEHAREQGYDLIVPSPQVYVSGRIDITDDVLERMRRAFERNP